MSLLRKKCCCGPPCPPCYITTAADYKISPAHLARVFDVSQACIGFHGLTPTTEPAWDGVFHHQSIIGTTTIWQGQPGSGVSIKQAMGLVFQSTEMLILGNTATCLWELYIAIQFHTGTLWWCWYGRKQGCNTPAGIYRRADSPDDADCYNPQFATFEVVPA